MKYLMDKVKLVFGGLTLKNIFPYLIYGLIGTFLIKDVVTPLLLGGRGFSGRNILIKISLFAAYFFVLVIFLFFIHKLYKKLVYRNSSVAYGKATNQLVIALIILSVGILATFIINNLAARIDTENWKLKGLNVFQVIEPIGNDFRVGLYWPAENLVKSGFKAIGPKNTYPSVYPPLVSVLSLPYLLFNAQTAFIINTILLFILNIFVLFIITLMINELLLKQVIKDQLTRNIISILIFSVIALYNFYSYSFLFSMERGNVDIIALFFSVLSIWILFKQPKNIWLQVIFLSIATHYKIYPAVLFMILLYFHGKKLILPMLVVNMAFLFVLGPKIAWAFLSSLTSGGGGAGLGNQWFWVGNHGAYSFSQNLTHLLPSLSNQFNFLFIATMLIPLLLWLLATLVIMKSKFSPINAIYLLMISIPLMDLLPTISNDYKLIIESTAFLLFIGAIIFQILGTSRDHLPKILLLSIIMFFIARPYSRDYEHLVGAEYTLPYFIDNKYLWILLFEGTMVWNILSQFKQKPVLQNNQPLNES